MLPRDHSRGQLRGHSAVRLEAQHVASDGAGPDRRFGEPIDRRARHGGNPTDHARCREIAPGPVTQERSRQHDRVRREVRRRLEEIFEAPVDPVADLDPLAVVRELLASRLHPQPLTSGRAHDHDGLTRPWVKPESEIERLPPPPAPPRARDDGHEREIGEGRRLHPDEHDRRTREDLHSILENERHRELPLRDDQVDPPPLVLRAEELTQLARERPAVGGIEVEELGVEMQDPRHERFERHSKRAIRADDRRRQAGFGVQQQDVVARFTPAPSTLDGRGLRSIHRELESGGTHVGFRSSDTNAVGRGLEETAVQRRRTM